MLWMLKHPNCSVESDMEPPPACAGEHGAGHGHPGGPLIVAHHRRSVQLEQDGPDAFGWRSSRGRCLTERTPQDECRSYASVVSREFINYRSFVIFLHARRNTRDVAVATTKYSNAAGRNNDGGDG